MPNNNATLLGFGFDQWEKYLLQLNTELKNIGKLLPDEMLITLLHDRTKLPKKTCKTVVLDLLNLVEALREHLNTSKP